MSRILCALALVIVLGIGPVAAAPTPRPPRWAWDATPGKVLFMIQTRGGVASPLQEVTALPDFVLYGDGTAIWTRYDAKEEMRQVWTAQLTQDEIAQQLDWMASLGYEEWYDRYEDASLADLPTTTYTMNLQDRTIKRLVYGLQFCLKANTVPSGFGEIYQRYSAFTHPAERLYVVERIVLYARGLSKTEARRGAHTLNWGVKEVKLADFALESETDYGRSEISGKDATRVVNRVKKWTLFSSDFSVFFFKEKKKEYQVGYRPLLPGE